MKKPWRNKLFHALLLMILSVGAVSAEEIVMVFGGGYPPFYTPDLNTGMYIDFLKRFEERHPAFSIQKVQLPRVRMDAWMKTGKAHAFSLNSIMFIPEPLRDNFCFSDPIWETTDHVIMRKGDTFCFQNPEDLFGRQVGVILGNGYGQYDPLMASGKITAFRVASTPQLYQMLLTRRIDACFGNIHADPPTMEANHFALDRFVFSRHPLLSFELVCQIQNTHAHFQKTLNRFIQTSRATGYLKALEDRYSHTRYLTFDNCME
ncbi:MAG: hypothetical protein D3926_01875 [Desulfobacteraceae bacterium]|nr:MAG: hypothetical protein D3926_01875 [Desulfobacteraceae bacterium]